MRSLTFVEIDIPDFADSSPEVIETLRFAIDTDYLPASIEAIPSLTGVQYTPATISLGGDLGQRATLRATFKDHRHIFAAEAFDAGTFWGKFRARYGARLRGYALRWIVGLEGQSLAQMNTRHFVIDSADGPSPAGVYTLTAKDVLKLADDDRALAPRPSNGILSTVLDDNDTAATMTPAGIGNLEYPASGHVAIGGSEICAFTRVADALTLTRAQLGTEASAHAQGERVQLVLSYSGEDPAVIIADLFTDYAGIDPAVIDLVAWSNETTSFLQRVYTANIAEPTGVNKLVSELIEQAALAVWWDDVGEKIRLQVLRPIATDAAVFDEDNTLKGSLRIAEQPATRVSQVYTYFNQRNPLEGAEDTDNYKSAALTVDLAADDAYGPSVKRIFSRWIPAGGRTTALRLNDLVLGRFKDAPRKFNLDLFRYGPENPVMGGGYRIESWCLQDQTGAASNAPVQVTRLNPLPDRYSIEAQEMLFTEFDLDDLSNRVIIVDADQNNVNMRTLHDQLYPEPTGTESPALTVTCIIESGVVIGSARPVDATPRISFDVGSWPSGVSLVLVINGEIQGHGGLGGNGGLVSGLPGRAGGTAFYTRETIDVEVNGAIRGGGGGGGGAGGVDFDHGQGGGGGGGGRGRLAGLGGAGAGGAANGGDGIPDGTGIGGQDVRGDTPSTGKGGDGGGFGAAGQAGQGGFLGGAAGAAGVAIDGDSFITQTGAGTIQGAQIN